MTEEQLNQITSLYSESKQLENFIGNYEGGDITIIACGNFMTIHDVDTTCEILQAINRRLEKVEAELEAL